MSIHDIVTAGNAWLYGVGHAIWHYPVQWGLIWQIAFIIAVIWAVWSGILKPLWLALRKRKTP